MFGNVVGRNKDVEKLIKLRVNTGTIADDVCNKVLTHVMKILKKMGQSRGEQFLKSITNPNDQMCLMVPKKELNKLKASSDHNLRTNDLAIPIILAKLYQTQPHYPQSNEIWEPVSNCVNHQHRNNHSICLHPHHIYVKSHSGPDTLIDNILADPGVESTFAVDPFQFDLDSLEPSHSPFSVPNHQPHSQTPQSQRSSTGGIPNQSWCSIYYYEFNQRLGQQFLAPAECRRVTIDGYTAPIETNREARFSLGVIGHINRNQEAELTRANIGPGISLDYRQRPPIDQSGSNLTDTVYCIRNNSETNSIFIQSPACSLRENWHVATVVKLPPGSELEIFSEIFFRDQISRVQMGPPNITNQVGHDMEQNQNEQIRRKLQDHTRLTNIKVSLIKGWGQGYRRSRLTSCPCWIEINLTKPAKDLDQVLQQYSVPGGNSTT